METTKKQVKKPISILLLIALISFICGSDAAGYSGGAGTETDPYQIATKADLLELAGTTADYNKFFILTADINMGGQVFVTAIIAPDTSIDTGFQGTVFTGTFDGNGHKIANFIINGGSNDYLGLFGRISTGSSIKNLSSENYEVSSTSGFYIGGLVGDNYHGNISNCYATGAVSSSGWGVGGLVGQNYSGNISNCHATCTISSGSGGVGGLVGYNSYDGNINNCYATGAVSSSGSGSGYIGGLVGTNGDGGSISNCYATCTVNGGSNSFCVGGLVGSNDSGNSISNCYAKGAVSSGSSSDSVGGLVGRSRNSGSISSCYATGTVNGGSYSASVGGLVGTNLRSSINNCYAKGMVSSGSYSYYVGGLVGENIYDGSISNCYATGTVSASYYVGGLVGTNDSYISNCYFLITSGPDNDCGEPLTDEQMKQQASFVGWDFVGEVINGPNDIWDICEGTNYPKLSWQIPLAGDFVCPDGVHFEDLAYLLERWLMTNCALNNDCDGTDMNTDGTVNFADFALFAQEWLEEEFWPYEE